MFSIFFFMKISIPKRSPLSLVFRRKLVKVEHKRQTELRIIEGIQIFGCFWCSLRKGISKILVVCDFEIFGMY